MTSRPDPATVAITFFYYRYLPAAMRFYEQVLGLPLVIDQGWAKIYRLAQGAHVGLVDERRGMQRAADPKPVQLCLRVPDVDAWYRFLCEDHALTPSEIFENPDLGIRAFTLGDPEGYQIEVQTALRPGA